MRHGGVQPKPACASLSMGIGFDNKAMLSEGSIIANTYQIVKEIGRGGTGTIYLAWHVNLRKYIVLKLIRTWSGNMDALRREADILKNLHHTGIPQIYDFVIENGQAFTVMEYIEGESLSNYLRGANVYPEEQLLSWFRKLTDVLVYLGRKHPAVIHSDIKPDNIIINSQGEPVLIDFNISLDINAAGRVAGFSRFYASPEQAYMAREILADRSVAYTLDPRTDIYSLGAVFYSLMCGLMPDSSTYTPRLRDMDGLIYSEAFRRVVDRCTEWERDRRFSDAEKLAKALGNLRRMDSNYRKYTVLKAVSWIVSAVIFASGCYCLIHGLNMRSRDNYLEAMNRLAQYTQDADFQSAGIEASGILNKYSGIMTDGEKAELYHVIGDSDYTGRDYSNAADNYRKAADLAEESGSKKGMYYSDIASALMMDGDVQGLAELSDMTAGEDGLQPEIELVRAAVLAENGDEAGCRMIADSVLDSDADDRTRANACLIISEGSSRKGGSYDPEMVRYLQLAVKLCPEAKFLRSCAAAEFYLAQEKGTSSYLESASEHLSSLCRGSGASAEDMLNLGIVYYSQGRYEDSIDMLHKAGLISERYEIPMYLALASYRMGDTDNAAAYCSEAIGAARKQQGQNTAEDIRMLEELSGMLN